MNTASSHFQVAANGTPFHNISSVAIYSFIFQQDLAIISYLFKNGKM